MSEQAPIKNLDPTLMALNPTGPEADSEVGAALSFFNQEFDLDIARDGALSSEPTNEQLKTLKAWRQETFVNCLFNIQAGRSLLVHSCYQEELVICSTICRVMLSTV